MLQGYFYDLYEFLYNLVDTFIAEIFGDGNEIITFLLITVPIIFLSLEAIFDFLIPTFLGGNPLFIRKWITPNFNSVKVPEIKYYRPARVYNNVKILKSSKAYTSFNRLSAAEVKHYSKLYQQKYNTTPKPYQLSKFYKNEVKTYNSVGFRRFNPVRFTLARVKKFYKFVSHKVELFKNRRKK